jgi:hypothetical protein
MNKYAWRFPLAVLGWAGLLLAGAAAARAHGPSGTLSERGYQEMQRLAHELDEAASHANEQAQHQQAWIYNNDRAFLRAIPRFADHAEAFHARMDTYRTRPWQVDDELRRLIREARDIQIRVQHARAVDDHTVADWNRVVQILNQMILVYQNDIARRSWGAWDGYGSRYGAPPPPAPDPSVYGNQAPDRGQLAALAHELAERTARIYQYATAAAGPFQADPRQRDSIDAIMHFRDQARAFHEQVESGLDPSRLGAYADHLAQDAREADARVRQTYLSPQIQEDWQQAMRLVNQIRAITAY